MELIKGIKEKRINPKNLNYQERFTVILCLRDMGMETHEITDFLKICTKTLYRYDNKIKGMMTNFVVTESLDRIAGDFIYSARTLYQKAMKAGNLELCWSIKCNMIDKLQSLGIIFRKPQEHKVEGNFEHTINDIAEQSALQSRYWEYITSLENRQQ